MQWRCNGYMARHYGLLSRLKVDQKKNPELFKALNIMKEYRSNKGKTPIHLNRNDFTYGYYDETYYSLKNLIEEMNSFIQTLE